jgi:heat shock protein HtpX
VFSAAKANKRNSLILLAAFVLSISAVAIWLGFALENQWVPIVVIGFVIIFTAVQYRMAAREIVTIVGAIPLTKADNALLWRLVENLSIREGLPMPRLYLIFDPTPNALAAGTSPDRALIAVTSGLLDLLDKAELEAVLAHEIGHIKNYDIRVKTIVFGLLGAVAFIALLGWALAANSLASNRTSAGGRNQAGAIAVGLGLVGAVVAAIASVLSHVIGPIIRSAVSRQREFLADASAVDTTRRPEALISALSKLEANPQELARADANSAHLFFVNPLRGRISMFFTATHPPISKRIERIRRIGTSLS